MLLQDTKIRVVLEGPPAPPSPVPEVNEQDEEAVARGGSAGTTHVDGFSSAMTTSAPGEQSGEGEVMQGATATAAMAGHTPNKV